MGNVSFYPVLYQLWVRNWKFIYLPNLFRISQKIKFWNFALYWHIIHTISPDVSPLLLFGTEILFHPKTVCHIMNGISYSWRMKISSSSWNIMFRCISCNILWKFSGSLKKAAMCMNWFINQEKTKYLPVT